MIVTSQLPSTITLFTSLWHFLTIHVGPCMEHTKARPKQRVMIRNKETKIIHISNVIEKHFQEHLQKASNTSNLKGKTKYYFKLCQNSSRCASKKCVHEIATWLYHAEKMPVLSTAYPNTSAGRLCKHLPHSLGGSATL